MERNNIRTYRPYISSESVTRVRGTYYAGEESDLIDVDSGWKVHADER